MTKPRTKGHAFEREIARLFRRWFPEARRGLQFRSGCEAPDVKGVPWWVECKRYSPRHVYRTSYGHWYDKAYEDMQAAREAGEVKDMDVMVIYKIDREPIRILVELSLLTALHFSGGARPYAHNGDTKHGVRLYSVTWDDLAATLDRCFGDKRKVTE